MTLERASSLARLARVHAPSGAPACEPGLGVQSSGGVAVFTVAFGLISVGGAAQVSSEADVALAPRTYILYRREIHARQLTHEAQDATECRACSH